MGGMQRGGVEAFSPYGFEDEGRVDDEHDAQGLGVVVLHDAERGGGASGKGHVADDQHMMLRDSG